MPTIYRYPNAEIYLKVVKLLVLDPKPFAHIPRQGSKTLQLGQD